MILTGENSRESPDLVERIVEGDRRDPEHVGLAEIRHHPRRLQRPAQLLRVLPRPDRNLAASLRWLARRDDLQLSSRDPVDQVNQIAREDLGLLPQSLHPGLLEKVERSL